MRFAGFGGVDPLRKKIIKFRIFRPMLPSMSKEKLYKIMYISRENI